MNVAYCRDCMEAMKEYPDKYFELAIVDPPYGGGCSQSVNAEREREDCTEVWQTTKTWNVGDLEEETVGLKSTILVNRTGGTWAEKYQGGIFSNDIRHWDISPPTEYFDELARISKNQIIWGGNYFDLPPTRCFIVWRKTNIPLEGFSMSPCEYAWTSFNVNAAMFECGSNALAGSEARFHPTQKPVALYKWLLNKYAKEGDKILDTHLGSGSSRIAAYDLGFDFTGFEIDKVYFEKQEERYQRHVSQLSLFTEVEGWKQES